MAPTVVASLLGSLHCVGMCGGLVSVYSGAASRPGLGHACYHSVRLASYAALGAGAGQLGAGLDWAGRWAGVQQAAAMAAGASMVAWGVWSLLRPPKNKGLVSLRPPGVGRVGQAVQRPALWLSQRAATQPKAVRAGLLGLVSALLPCGWLYAFVISAAGTGSASAGALLMLAFGAGTLPALLGLGAVMHWLGQRLRRVLPRLTAWVLIALGMSNVAMRWPSEHAASGQGPACHDVD